MALNVISNFAANVAHRNLMNTDMETTQSLARLSSGKRVLTAKDDAASLAIGSRLRAEVAALQAARVNAGQAASMLQVADGAMSQIDDILVRMKSLSIQAGSSQYGDVERSLIDAEFQQILLEISRIAEDTEFNGNQLLDGGELIKLGLGSDPSSDGVGTIALDSTVEDGAVFQYSYSSSDEILTVTKLGVSDVTDNAPRELVERTDLTFSFDQSVADDAVFAYSFDQTTDQFTITNRTTGDAATIDVTQAYQNAFGAGATTVPAGQTLDVTFNTLGVTVTFEQGFDFTSAIPAANDAISTDTGDWTITGATAATYPSDLSDAAVTALNALLTAGQVDLAATTAGGAGGTLALDADANFAFGVDGGTPGNLNAASGDLDAANSVQIYIDVDGDGTAETQVASIDTSTVSVLADGASAMRLDFNQRVYNVQTIDAAQDQSVQVDLTADLDAKAGSGQNLSFSETLDVDIQQFGVTLTLDKSFDRTNDLTGTIGSVGATLPTGVTNASFASNTTFFTDDVYQALLDLGYDSSTGVGYNPITGVLSLQVSQDAGSNVTLDSQPGINFGFGDGNATGDLAAASPSTTEVSITLPDGSSVLLGSLTAAYTTPGAGILGTVDIQLGRGVFFNTVNPDAGTTEFTFKIGTGNEPEDDVTIQFNAVDATALGLNGVNVRTEEAADASSVSISNAISTLNTARANIGALQNRLDIASSNLAVSMENTEAARSQLLDLDVAQEMTEFTSKQVLLQAGVSMLAQANQLPQNLLRLFQ